MFATISRWIAYPLGWLLLMAVPLMIDAVRAGTVTATSAENRFTVVAFVGEYDARRLYTESREVCRVANDFVSMDLFENLLRDEESHINFLETQLRLLADLGPERYGLLQAEGADEAE